MTEPTDAALVEQYIKLRDKKAAMKKAYEESLEPYDKALDSIEGVMHKRLLERGADSVRTEFGTAFKSTLTKYRVADKDAFKGFVIENRAWNLLSADVDKDAAIEWAKEHEGVPPPGVDVTQIIDVKFRKA